MFTPSILGSFHLAVGEYEVSLVPYILICVAGIILFLPIVLFRKWYAYRRRIKANLITSEYEPPAGLTPAEVQYLFGGINTERITAATIIHMVQHGFIHMRKTDGKKLIYPGPKESDKLKMWERMILNQVAAASGISADRIMKKPITFVDKGVDEKHTDSTTLSDFIAESLHQRGLIAGKAVNKFFFDGFKVALLFIFALIWWPILLFWFMNVLESTTSDFASINDFIMTALILTAIAVIPIVVFSVFFVKWRARLIGRRWMSTDRLTRLWPQMMGYRHFVKLTEKDRLKFDSEELQKSSSKDILPYAVALGFVDNWRDIVS